MAVFMLTGALPANANASKTPCQFLTLKNGNMTIKVSDMIKQLGLTSKITCTYRPMVEMDYTYGFSVEIVGLSAMNMTYAAISPVFQAMRADWTGAKLEVLEGWYTTEDAPCLPEGYGEEGEDEGEGEEEVCDVGIIEEGVIVE